MAKDVSSVFSTHTCHDCQKTLQEEAAIWANISSDTLVTVSIPIGKERH